MKKLVLALTFSLTASAVLAGGVAEPAMSTEEVVANASSSQGYVVPLLLLLALVIAASNRAAPVNPILP
jgi:hypothetical protein